MAYLNLIPAILVIAAYFLGRYIGRRSRDIEVTKLTVDRDRLATMLDFTQAECEHAKGLVGEKIAMADNPLRSVPSEQFYGLGEIGLMRQKQERYTAAMRKKIDDALGL